jgi:hypothetical protein
LTAAALPPHGRRDAQAAAACNRQFTLCVRARRREGASGASAHRCPASIRPCWCSSTGGGRIPSSNATRRRRPQRCSGPRPSCSRCSPIGEGGSADGCGELPAVWRAAPCHLSLGERGLHFKSGVSLPPTSKRRQHSMNLRCSPVSPGLVCVWRGFRIGFRILPRFGRSSAPGEAQLNSQRAGPFRWPRSQWIFADILSLIARLQASPAPA